MLFKVRWKVNWHTYTVYSVKNYEKGECVFLIYEHHEHRWKWIDADQCEPIDG